MDDDLDRATALTRAARRAQRTGASMFVVWSGSGYAVASEDDLDTWWLGATVIAEVLSDGTCVACD